MIYGAAITEVITLGQVKVPPAPLTALRIKRRIQDADCSLDELAQLISVDPALSAAVLRLAGAPALPQPPSSSVKDAVQRIGLEELGRVALTVNAADVASTDGPLAPLRLLAWRRSLISAFVCRFVAERRGGKGDDAFACGLLHDFGWIVALSTLEELLARAPDEECRPAESWLALVDQFHILLGHIVATRWNLSPLIAEVILCHHDPEQASALHRPMVQLVASCDRLVMLLEQQPAVSEAEIAAVPGFEGELAGLLAEALPRVAAAASRLLDLAPPPVAAPVSPPPPSRVSRPPQTLHGKIKAVRWDLAWLSANGPVPGVVTAIGSDGMVALLQQPPKENFIVKFGLGAGGDVVELFVTPMVVEPEAGQHRVEARLFALGGGPKAAWDRLYRTAPAA
jgi:HD-like signal output (HDOD) protein